MNTIYVLCKQQYVLCIVEHIKAFLSTVPNVLEQFDEQDIFR